MLENDDDIHSFLVRYSKSDDSDKVSVAKIYLDFFNKRSNLNDYYHCQVSVFLLRFIAFNLPSEKEKKLWSDIWTFVTNTSQKTYSFSISDFVSGLRI